VTRPRSRRIVALYVVYLLLLVEAASRVFLVVTHGASWLHPDQAIYAFYPELRQERSRGRARDPGAFHILLLGASALHPDWGQVVEALTEELSRRTPRRVVVHNLSSATHASLDSLIKYRQLGDQRYDLVVFYHGINETRANNCPPRVFKADYSHYSWYRVVNFMDQNPRCMRWLATPYVVEYGWTRLLERLGLLSLLPREIPRQDWVRYGGEIKTARSFEANLSQIVEIARGRHERLLLLTYAYYVPADYSLPRLLEGRLDYAACKQRPMPIEVWGDPRHVVEGIEAHNEKIRQVARRSREVLFLDLEQRIPKSGELFCDVCHLSPAGSEAVASAIADVVLEVIRASPPGVPSA
jgi:hypothetical protein